MFRNAHFENRFIYCTSPIIMFNFFLVAFINILLWKGYSGILLHHLQVKARNLTDAKEYGLETNTREFRTLFLDFIRYFDKEYRPNTVEFEYRFEVFMQSLERQRKLNLEETKHKGSAQYGLNQFSDLTPKEFKEFLGREIENSSGAGEQIVAKPTFNTVLPCTISSEIKPPKKKDWAEEKKVTAVKNQGHCGSCWAFSAAEQVESYWAIAGNPLIDLSVQELLSCTPSLGCNGGNTCFALRWLTLAYINQSRIELIPAKLYPYEDDDTECDTSKLSARGAYISNVCGCQPLIGREDIMKLVLAQKGPMAVNVNAVLWHDYISGIIQHHCTNLTMNHAVQLVGYDFTGGVPYWKLRNSWGPDFGENGYLRVKYGENTCGVAQEPSFVGV